MKNKKNIIFLIVIAISILCIVFLGKQLYDCKYESYISDAMRKRELDLLITIEETQIDYYHLGRDVSIVHTCNGQTVSSGDIVLAKNKMIFETVITEHDSIEDVGKETTTMALTGRGTGIATRLITVTEDGGTKYKDAYATWRIRYTVKPDPKDLRFWKVIFS